MKKKSALAKLTAVRDALTLLDGIHESLRQLKLNGEDSSSANVTIVFHTTHGSGPDADYANTTKRSAELKLLGALSLLCQMGAVVLTVMMQK